MSLTKSIGGLFGAALGAIIVGLLLIDTHHATRLVVAAILAGMFLGAGLGAYIGSTDRKWEA